jgi:Fic family protein
MVRIGKKVVKGKPYYYLEHTMREKDRRTTKTRYLGSELPKDIGKIRKEFAFELDRKKWFNDFEGIRRSYKAELRDTPQSARLKALREFAVRFTYNTQRIEGSTLTLRETAQLLEDRISPRGKPIEDSKEAEAHQAVFLEMLKLKSELSLKLVQDWHWKMFKETKPDIAGQIRRHGVRISGSNFIPPTPVELQPMLREFFSWYDKDKSKLNPVELAALVHLKFVTIHPFSDGNGRISRLMMNFALNKHEYPMLNIEYTRRASYYRSLERSQINKDDRPFANWLFRRYLHDRSNTLKSE